VKDTFFRPLRTLRRAPLICLALTSTRHAETDASHVRAASQWLLEAQRACGGTGYAHSFHLIDGWQRAYPETTGYIIPTLCTAARRYGLPGLRESASRAARWLDSIQRTDGSFCDLDGRPQVFDTGQILIGLNFLAEHAPELALPETQIRAGRWLCSQQERDGSFVRHAYNGAPHAYYSRVGAALVKAGRLAKDDALHEAGVKNLQWTLAQQEPNGFLKHLSFDQSPPYLHTMIYAIEGLLDGYEEMGDAAFLAGACAFADRLLEVAQTRDSILRSQYRDDFTVANAEKCLVGLAQWAGVCFRLGQLKRSQAHLDQALTTVDLLKRSQIRCSDPRLHGALMGSAPLWGRYMRLAAPNWGVKFFIDALLSKAQLEVSIPTHSRGMPNA
jgi:hypothetical protein